MHVTGDFLSHIRIFRCALPLAQAPCPLTNMSAAASLDALPQATLAATNAARAAYYDPCSIDAMQTLLEALRALRKHLHDITPFESAAAMVRMLRRTDLVWTGNLMPVARKWHEVGQGRPWTAEAEVRRLMETSSEEEAVPHPYFTVALVRTISGGLDHNKVREALCALGESTERLTPLAAARQSHLALSLASVLSRAVELVPTMKAHHEDRVLAFATLLWMVRPVTTYPEDETHVLAHAAAHEVWMHAKYTRCDPYAMPLINCLLDWSIRHPHTCAAPKVLETCVAPLLEAACGARGLYADAATEHCRSMGAVLCKVVRAAALCWSDTLLSAAMEGTLKRLHVDGLNACDNAVHVHRKPLTPAMALLHVLQRAAPLVAEGGSEAALAREALVRCCRPQLDTMHVLLQIVLYEAQWSARYYGRHNMTCLTPLAFATLLPCMLQATSCHHLTKSLLKAYEVMCTQAAYRHFQGHALLTLADTAPDAFDALLHRRYGAKAKRAGLLRNDGGVVDALRGNAALIRSLRARKCRDAVALCIAVTPRASERELDCLIPSRMRALREASQRVRVRVEGESAAEPAAKAARCDGTGGPASPLLLDGILRNVASYLGTIDTLPIMCEKMTL